MCVACLAFILENISTSSKRILTASNSLQFVKLLLNKSVYPHEVTRRKAECSLIVDEGA